MVIEGTKIDLPKNKNKTTYVISNISITLGRLKGL